MKVCNSESFPLYGIVTLRIGKSETTTDVNKVENTSTEAAKQDDELATKKNPDDTDESTIVCTSENLPLYSIVIVLLHTKSYNYQDTLRNGYRN